HSLPLNPTPETLARYIAYTSQFIASGPKYLSGARHFLRDIFPDFDTHRSHPSVQATIAGARKLRGEAVRRKLPLRTSHLATFVHIAVLSKCYDDLLFATMLSCMFYACHRSGELLVKATGSTLDWRKIIKRSSLEFSGSRASYTYPTTKATVFTRVLPSSTCATTSVAQSIFFATTSVNVIVVTVPRLRCSCEKMGPFLRVLGLNSTSSQSSTTPTEAIRRVLVERRTTPDSAYQRLSYRLSVAGLQQHGRTTFETTRPYVPSLNLLASVCPLSNDLFSAARSHLLHH
ncbi:uncharacterized protein B0H18DRAFT_1195171, partial [Fomitopsis serialis]|uniref:uncharacterized protein n=1 Tax=Fomitopsis serialis TaxID=139415 RepID=UPI0020082FB0